MTPIAIQSIYFYVNCTSIVFSIKIYLYDHSIGIDRHITFEMFKATSVLSHLNVSIFIFWYKYYDDNACNRKSNNNNMCASNTQPSLDFKKYIIIIIQMIAWEKWCIKYFFRFHDPVNIFFYFWIILSCSTRWGWIDHYSILNFIQPYGQKIWNSEPIRPRATKQTTNDMHVLKTFYFELAEARNSIEKQYTWFWENVIFSLSFCSFFCFRIHSIELHFKCVIHTDVCASMQLVHTNNWKIHKTDYGKNKKKSSIASDQQKKTTSSYKSIDVQSTRRDKSVKCDEKRKKNWWREGDNNRHEWNATIFSIW